MARRYWNGYRWEYRELTEDEKEDIRSDYKTAQNPNKHKGWAKRNPISYYLGPKEDLTLVATEKCPYGSWLLYEYDKERRPLYYTELVLK